MSGKNIRERLYEDVMTAATPSIRRNNASRFARRSVHQPPFRESNVSMDESAASPTILQVSQTPRIRTRISEQSIALRFDSPSVNYQDESFKQRKSLILEESINLETKDEIQSIRNFLYEDFFHFYSQNGSDQNILDLLLGYEQCCCQAVNSLEQMIQKSVAKPSSKLGDFVKCLRLERNTWRLLRILTQDRIHCQEEQDEEFSEGCRLSDKRIVDDLFRRDSQVRQAQLVVDWLEKNLAEEINSASITKADYFLESHTSWENTRHSLERCAKEQPRPLVTQLDPDAPFRQKRPLHDLDVKDENEVMKYIFALILAGKLDEAERAGERHGYLWLSAALEGWRPHHDPNYNKENLHEGEMLEPTEGNPFRDVWKVAAWNLLNQEVFSKFESGIYSALSGHLPGLLRCCTSWEDHLWSYVRVLVDNRVDQEIRGATQQERPLESLPPVHWKIPRSMDEIMKELESSPQEGIPESCLLPHHVVQKHVILDQTEALLEVMMSLMDSGSRPEILRFMVHYVLFVSLISGEYESYSVSYLNNYVRLLVEEDQKLLVAPYASHLPAQLQVDAYAEFLEDILDRAEQRRCLENAESCGMNVHLITRTLVGIIHSRVSQDEMQVVESAGPQLTVETSSEDEKKICALDWLTFDRAQCSDALKYGNALIRKFVVCRKIEAAKKTFFKLPSDSIHIITKHWKNLTNSEELPAEEANTVREYLCFQTYLQALESFDDWFSHFHVSRPIEPLKPSGQQVAFTEWVSYEHKFKQFQGDLERWRQALKHQMQITVDQLYNVLLFPDGGWMVDARPVQGDESRQRSLCLLRRLVIPQVAALLQIVFLNSGMRKKLLRLADVLADQKNSLCLEFSKEQLGDFLLKIRESSLSLLDQNLDPFGYPFQ